MRKLIAMLLSIAMMLSMVPAGAFATALETEPAAETQSAVQETIQQETAPAQTEAPETEAPETEPQETEPQETEVPETETTGMQAEETAAAEEAAAEVTVEVSETVVPTAELPDSDELYDAYLQRLFYGSGASILGTGAREQLTELEQKFYDVLKSEILKIAAGKRASTVVEIDGELLTQWGLNLSVDITGMDISTDEGLQAAAQLAHDALFAQINQRNVVNALMNDCPYEMYWYDKSTGTLINSACSIFDGQASVARVVFAFRVVGDMQPQGYNLYMPTIDTSSASAAQTAADTARSIVDAYAALGDYEKLTAYRDEICSLVSYDYASAGYNYYTHDADPWQLLYVFDGDSSTNVVCEGYSKAFQYLCDLSTFRGAVSCCTVVGTLDGGGHMWNVVTLDGSSYMVDVTNSDTGTAGENGGMFLAGTAGSVAGGYTFLGYTFAYKEETVSLWGEEILTLASSDYVPGTDIPGENESEQMGTMSQEELEAAIAAADGADYFLKDKVYITSDMTLTSWVYIEEGAELHVCDGATVTMEAVVLFVGGKLTIQEGGSLTVRRMYLYGGWVTNYGALKLTSSGNLYVGESAVVNNYGKVILPGANTLDNWGIWNGNAPVYEQSYEDLLDAIEEGYAEITAKVTLEGDLNTNAWISINQGGELIVPDGITLTVSDMGIYGGKLTIEDGGTLVNTSYIYVGNGGVLENNGTYAPEQYASLAALYGTTTVTGIDHSGINLICECTTEDQIREALAMTDYRNVSVRINRDVTLSESLTVDGVTLDIVNGGTLTVLSNAELRFSDDAQLEIYGGSLYLKAGAVLTLDASPYVYIGSDGNITAEAGAVVNGNKGVINLERTGNTTAEGVDPSLITACYQAETEDEIIAAIADGKDYYAVDLRIVRSLTLGRDLIIAENVRMNLYSWYEETCVTVPEDVTLTNLGVIFLGYGTQLWIEAGGTMDNQGEVWIQDGSLFINNGTLLGKEPGESGGGSSYDAVYTMEELLAALNSGNTWITVQGSITLTSDVTIPMATYIYMWEGSELIVPNGITLTVAGGIDVYGGKLQVSAGGHLLVSGGVYIGYGEMRVNSGADFQLVGNGSMTVVNNQNTVVSGVDKSLYTLHCPVYSEEEIRQALKITGYGWVTVFVDDFITLKSNLTIPEGKSLVIGYTWYEGEDIAASLTVPSGVTLTNKGMLSVTDIGMLEIQKGGKLVNDGSVYVYGTLSNAGTITGEGYMDYARPAYSYEELLALLSADTVPTYIYIWDSLTLEGDVTIPEGTELIVEGGTLVVPSGCTVTVNGELYAQYGGVATFQPGSKLINNNWIEAYIGTINIYGEYKEANEDVILMLYPNSTINGVDNSYIYYMVSFNDEASMVEALEKVAREGYGAATVYVELQHGVVEVYGDVTIPENAYLMMGNYYGDSMVLKSGAVLTNYGGIYVSAPGTLTIEDGAQLVDYGYVNADEGCIIYMGGDLFIAAQKTEIYAKEKLTLTASVVPESMSGAKVTWTLAEGQELYASLKVSGKTAVLTAADVTEKQTVLVTASAVLDNGEEVSDTVEITIVPLIRQITLVSDGQDVTNQTISFDLNHIPEGWTEPQRTLNLTAVIAPGDADQNLVWTSSSDAIATVKNGVVTFTDKGGKVTITATAADGSKVSAKVTIQAEKLVQSIALLEGDTELVGGKGTTLKVQDTTKPGTALAASVVAWALADEADAAYVTVTAAGKVTTKAVLERRQVTLVGTINNNPEAEPVLHTITIYPAVVQVDIYARGAVCSGETLKLDYADTLILNASQYPAEGMGDVAWEVSDKTGKLVTFDIDENNCLSLKPTGVKGNVTVKAVASDGSKKSASVKLQLGSYVSEISVTAAQNVIRSGESLTLTASVLPASANQSVTWSLADDNDKQFVSVSSAGKVSAKNGLVMSKEITILATAKDGTGVYGSCTLLLEPADPGALIIVDETENVTGTTLSVDLLKDPSVKLKARYFNADSADVTWSGKGVTISQPDEDGFVTVTATGKGTFTVTADDGSGKVSVKLKAANLSEKLIISGGTEVASGKTLQLKAVILPEGQVADKKVTWWIDEADAAYAKISSGKITAAKNLTEARTITVWAQANDGNSAPESYCVTIQPLARGVQILNGLADVSGTTRTWDLTTDTGKLELGAKVFPADAGQGVTWRVSGAKVVEQEADGSWSFTGKTGKATITATASDGSGKKASFVLEVIKSMDKIEKTVEGGIIAGGKSLKMTGWYSVDKDVTNKKVAWSVSGDTEAVAKLTNGVLTTNKVTEKKTVIVTVTALDGSGCSADFTVEVYPVTTKVSLLCNGGTPAKQELLEIGESVTLKGISLPSAAAQGAGAYTWKVSGEKYADWVENEDGTITVTGKAKGTVTITCTAADSSGQKATLKIKVG